MGRRISFFSAFLFLSAVSASAESNFPSISTEHVTSTSRTTQLELPIDHTPPKESELPFPGSPLSLYVYLKKEPIELSMRAYVVRDGKLMEVFPDGSTIDSSDRTIFKIEVPSPLETLAYQFIFSDNTGRITLSKRYEIRRTCYPETQASTPDPAAAQTDPTGEVARLITRTRTLQNELDLFNRNLVLLEEIQKMVGRE